MKAIISSIKEGVKKSAERHTLLVFWRDAEQALSVGNDAIQKALLAGGVALGATDYQTTVDLVSIFGEEAKVNGVYSPELALQKAKDFFKVGTIVDNEKFNLFDIPLKEVDPRYETLLTQDGRIFTSYRRAGYFTREECINILKSSLANSLATGGLIVPKTESAPAPAPTTAALQSALLQSATNEEGV